MKDYEKLLSKLNASNPMSLIYEFGMNQEDIKESIIDSFRPYFKNYSNLTKYAVSDLVGTWLSYLTILKERPNFLKYIKVILKIFNNAKQIDENGTLKIYLEWLSDLNQSVSRYWSLYNTQSNILNLCVEDYLEEAMRVIGQTIEGLSKPYLKLLLYLNRIVQQKKVDFSELQSKDLGIVIDELINSSDLGDLFVISPMKIRLNQWRNIAYHHNSRILGGKILLTIKKKEISEEFEITKKELYDVLKEILEPVSKLVVLLNRNYLLVKWTNIIQRYRMDFGNK
ncbi:hypothetical protein LEP1GSC039_0955 [Leptospira santarosai str. 2000027870]|uniref:hypothetical protein n=1 Tax=Leptospira santarosai TaxID=28183 RepID=UPI0002BF6D12|nr:hypothetical protein [Leptospira santarosai]EMM87467.1 hypothetical protein LEP1GSC039_0955 [Leptospira santarosai str. 2000027870]